MFKFETVTYKSKPIPTERQEDEPTQAQFINFMNYRPVISDALFSLR